MKYLLIGTVSAAIFAWPGPLNTQQLGINSEIEVLINPLQGTTPTDKWYVAVWSLPRSIVNITTSQNYSAQNPARNSGLNLFVDRSRLSGIMDTRTIPTPNGRLATVVLKQDFVPGKKAWSDHNRSVTFSAPLRITESQQTGEMVTYIGATFVLFSPSVRRSFWLQVQLFDSRGKPGLKPDQSPALTFQTRDRIICSPSRSTNLPILLSTAGTESNFVNFTKASANLMSQGPTEGTFTFSLSKGNIKSMLTELAGLEQWCASNGRFRDAESELIELRQASIMVETQFGKSHPGEVSQHGFSRLGFQIERPTVTFN